MKTSHGWRAANRPRIEPRFDITPGAIVGMVDGAVSLELRGLSNGKAVSFRIEMTPDEATALSKTLRDTVVTHQTGLAAGMVFEAREPGRYIQFARDPEIMTDPETGEHTASVAPPAWYRMHITRVDTYTYDYRSEYPKGEGVIEAHFRDRVPIVTIEHEIRDGHLVLKT